MKPTPEEIALKEVTQAIQEKIGRRMQYVEYDLDILKFMLLPEDPDGQVTYVEVKTSIDKWMGKPPKARASMATKKKPVEEMTAEQYRKLKLK